MDALVANEKVHSALRYSVRLDPRIRWTSHAVARVDSSGASVTLADDSLWHADRVVLAAGAWSSGIAGVPARIPLEPARGQMLTLRASGLTRPAFGAGGYVIPRRDGRIFVGSTMERVGFDPSVTQEACNSLGRVASLLIPDLESREVLESWSGLRPMSPDGMPIIGMHPEAPGLCVATGHSKNGILLGPLTAEVVADLVIHGRTDYDISSFAPERFGDANTPV
jgi:glycine oxidase